MLNWHLAHWGYAFNDGKWMTPTITNMGFRMIPRGAFRMRLATAVHGGGKAGRWQAEADARTVAEWQPGGSATPTQASSAA